MRPILCVIDLTESSAAVLEVAARIAFAFKTHLTVVFPYRLVDYGYKGDLVKLKIKLVDDAREKFCCLKKHITLLDQLSYEFQPEIGFSADRITSYLKLNVPSMIVMSQYQANAMNELGGMELQNLITDSKLPFTIVPKSDLCLASNR
jgi:hypothetical protein